MHQPLSDSRCLLTPAINRNRLGIGPQWLSAWRSFALLMEPAWKQAKVLSGVQQSQ